MRVMQVDTKQLAYEAYAHGKYRAALPLLVPLANQDDVDALLAVAWINETGVAGPSDLEYAKRCYLRAADLGSCNALYRLGRLLREENDLRGAIVAFERGAKQDYLPCMSALGLLLIRVSESREQKEAAMICLSEAAGRGHYYAKKGVVFYRIKETNTYVQLFKLSIEYFSLTIACSVERIRNRHSLKIL